MLNLFLFNLIFKVSPPPKKKWKFGKGLRKNVVLNIFGTNVKIYAGGTILVFEIQDIKCYTTQFLC